MIQEYAWYDFNFFILHDLSGDFDSKGNAPPYSDRFLLVSVTLSLFHECVVLNSPPENPYSLPDRDRKFKNL